MNISEMCVGGSVSGEEFIEGKLRQRNYFCISFVSFLVISLPLLRNSGCAPIKALFARLRPYRLTASLFQWSAADMEGHSHSRSSSF